MRVAVLDLEELGVGLAVQLVEARLVGVGKGRAGRAQGGAARVLAAGRDPVVQHLLPRDQGAAQLLVGAAVGGPREARAHARGRLLERFDRLKVPQAHVFHFFFFL